jgi:hypothetical protein
MSVKYDNCSDKPDTNLDPREIDSKARLVRTRLAIGVALGA